MKQKRDATLIVLLSTESIKEESAVALSLLIFTLTYLQYGLIGFICFMRLKIDDKK